MKEHFFSEIPRADFYKAWESNTVLSKHNLNLKREPKCVNMSS